VTTVSRVSGHPILAGIIGGTGSGKTSVLREILKGLDVDDVLVIQHDC
jgi:uridine kinase